MTQRIPAQEEVEDFYCFGREWRGPNDGTPLAPASNLRTGIHLVISTNSR